MAFSFGTTPSAGASAAAPAAGAPAPAAGGFNFGTAAPTTTPAAAAPAPALVAASTIAAPTPAAEHQPTATIPSFDDVFPRLSVERRVSSHLLRCPGGSEPDSSLEGQDLIHALSTSGDASATSSASAVDGPMGKLLSDPKSILFPVRPDPALRSKLRSNPYVTLRGTLAVMTPSILDDALKLSDELRISELDAVALYAEASAMLARSAAEGAATWTTGNGNDHDGIYGSYGSFADALVDGGKSALRSLRERVRRRQESSPSQQQQPQQLQQGQQQPTRPSDVVRTARDLFFRERSALLSTVIQLVKHRIQAAEVEAASAAAPSSSPRPSTSSPAILAATDQLLSSKLADNLILCVKELTRLNSEIGQGLRDALEQEEAAAVAASTATAAQVAPPFGFAAAAPPPAPSPPKNDRDMEYALHAFTFHQRQVASECLFYLAYHTQLTADETAGLIDLVRDLTNGGLAGGGSDDDGLLALDPLFDNVPSPYASQPGMMMGGVGVGAQTIMPGQQQPPPFFAAGGGAGEKDPRTWEEELVSDLWGRGKPQLLQCVGTLVLGVVCALDAHHILMDREVHGPNTFGVGNALLPPQPPPGTSAAVPPTDALGPIHSRLDPSHEPNASWKRQDIRGLLSASYALLLRPSASLLTSPRLGSQRSPTGFFSSPSPHRHRGGGSAGRVDLKSTFRSCLEAPILAKSLTFARMSLLPSFGMPSMIPASGGNTTSVAAGRNDASPNFAFFMSVLSEFTSQYVDALCASMELPISRAQWRSDEEKELQLLRMQEQQRQQFDLWSGDAGTAQQRSDPIPTEVDVRKRPDCIDDVIALACAVCSACPDCSGQFWSTTEELSEGDEEHDADHGAGFTIIRLAPSRALRKMELLQADDVSLLPVYVALLAALALADGPDGSTSHNGASAIHSILTNDRAISTSSDRNAALNWTFILNMIRWFADELTSPATDVSAAGIGAGTAESLRRTSSTTSYETAGIPSTAYYYGAESNATEGGRGSFSKPAPGQGQGGNSSSSSSISGGSQRKELGEDNTNLLLSLLSLVSQVASKSPLAREYILSVKLPLPSGAIGTASEDDALTVLFSLLTIPITPEIRGLTLVAIANLIRCDSPGEKMPMQAQKESGDINGRKAWALLDACELLPIGLLGQYESSAAGVSTGTTQSMARISWARDNAAGQVSSTSSSWFPPSEKYGILYEMEHVESLLGSYPATEGFLYLITTLISSVGCPSELGSHWRPRTGCAPYVEYATSFVLPRAMDESDKMNFATPADKCRLICRGLEVVKAAIVRYIVPPPARSDALAVQVGSAASAVPLPQESVPTTSLEEAKSYYQSIVRSASEMYGMGPVISDIFLEVDAIEVRDIGESVNDFRDDYSAPQHSLTPGDTATSGGVPDQQHNAYLGLPSVSSESSLPRSLPRAKTVGFAILSDILSSSGGSLFHILTNILADNRGSHGIHVMYGQAVHSKLLAMALFGDTPPTFLQAKAGADYAFQMQQQGITDRNALKIAPSFAQSMMQPLRPPIVHTILDLSNQTSAGSPHQALSHDAVLWRERSVLLSLQVLCAAASREDAFGRAIHSSPNQQSVVPVLRFKAPVHSLGGHRGLEARVVNVSRLSQLLISSSGSSAFQHGHFETIIPVIADYIGYGNTDLARAAVSVVAYISHTLSHQDSVHALCGASMGARLADSIARGLSMHAFEDGKMKNEEVRSIILDLLILSNIRFDMGRANLSHILLGLSGGESTQKWRLPTDPCATSRSNCLDAVLTLVADIDFVLNPDTAASASKCYEIIYRVCSLKSKQDSMVRLEKIRFMARLRSMGFWFTHATRFFRAAGSSPSLLHAVEHSAQNDGTPPASARNNDLLHSMSWLLKGIAIELHSLLYGVPTDNDVHVSSSPSQCRQLLSLLFSEPHPIMFSALMDIPLAQSSRELDLLGGITISREKFQLSSRPLEGPMEICGGYEVVDRDLLLHNIREGSSGSLSPNFSAALSESELAAVKFTKTWNTYVQHACALSHLAAAWSAVIGSSFISCRPILIGGKKGETQGLLDHDLLVELTCTLLARLTNIDQRCALNMELQQLPPTDSADDIETGSALPLSVAALRLVEVLLDLYASAGSGEISIGDEDMSRVCALLAGAIASCARISSKLQSRSDERAAVLCCALTGVLSLLNGHSVLDLAKSSPNLMQVYVSAAKYLASLASMSRSNTDAAVAKTAREEKKYAVALSARTCMSALLAYFDGLERQTKATEFFLLQIFDPVNTHGEAQSVDLLGMVRLLAGFDTDISNILIQVSSCQCGTELLIKSGVLDALNATASECAKEAGVNRERETYGATQLEPPMFLVGHLSLLNSMLASPLPISVRQQLTVNASHFIKIHSCTFNRLLSSYPRTSDLTMKFITCLFLISSTDSGTRLIDGAGDRSMSRRNAASSLRSVLGDPDFLDLEHRVLDLIYHLSEYPFPPNLLPALPPRLRDAERSLMTKRKFHVAVNTEQGGSWWDLIKDDERDIMLDGVQLPDPPTGADAGGWLLNTGRIESGKGNIWSEGKYSYAISAARCLEVCLLFLTDQVKKSAEACLHLGLDGVALGKGLCRCSDASRAIDDRLRAMHKTSEAQITSMMDHAGIMDNDVHSMTSSELSQLEQNALSELGPILGRCAEMLLALASMHGRLLAHLLPSAKDKKSEDDAKDFAFAVIPALEHTQMETMGIGCIGLEAQFKGRSEFGKVMANKLREDLEQICSHPGRI